MNDYMKPFCNNCGRTYTMADPDAGPYTCGDCSRGIDALQASMEARVTTHGIFNVSKVSYSGQQPEDSESAERITGLDDARAYAHELTTQYGMFNAWVQGNGYNECHTGTQADCSICQNK